MAKKKLSDLELRLKKLAALSKAYTDAHAVSGGAVNLIVKATANNGCVKSYILANGVSTESEVTNENLIGEIDIPKDYLVKSSKLLTVEAGTGADSEKWMVTKENGSSVTAYEAPSLVTSEGQWLDFVINSVDNDGSESHLCVNLSSFIDTYSGGDGIDITNKVVSVDLAANSGLEVSGGKLKAKIGANANGLSLTSNGIELATATPSVNGSGGSGGAMSAQDKENLNKMDSNLLTDAEIGSWYGYASNSTMVTTTLPSVSDNSITDE